MPAASGRAAYELGAPEDRRANMRTTSDDSLDGCPSCPDIPHRRMPFQQAALSTNGPCGVYTGVRFPPKGSEPEARLLSDGAGHASDLEPAVAGRLQNTSGAAAKPFRFAAPADSTRACATQQAQAPGHCTQTARKHDRGPGNSRHKNPTPLLLSTRGYFRVIENARPAAGRSWKLPEVS